ncbi:hypothetical protein HanPSC8_Chr01g0024391 [Helianthus annuus]|nr:hypothetical protein HanPSC8_Chr01g0024391 [Helianthus annuus]
MLTYIINIMYFPPLLVILYLGSDVPMKLKVVFLLLLPWSLRWTVINLLEKLNFMLYYQWIVASRPHVQGNIQVTRLALMEAHQHFSYRNGFLDTCAYDIHFLQVFTVPNHIGQSERKLATQAAQSSYLEPPSFGPAGSVLVVELANRIDGWTRFSKPF